MKRQKVKTSRSDLIFYIINGMIITLFFLVVLYPIIFVIAASFSSGDAVSGGRVFLWPVEFSLDGYKTVFNNSAVLTGFRNSLLYMAVGTAINVVLTMCAAYALTRVDVPGINKIMFLFTFTMFFSGGMIPNYILIRNLHIMDSMWAMVLPGAINAYNLIIARTFIQSNIPKELYEAAQMDGCTDIRFFLKIVLPLSGAVIAVLVLFYGVAHWNSYFNAMLYLNSPEKYSLPIILKQILISSQIDPSTVSDPELQLQIARIANVIKYALIVVTMIPIVIIYPFIQRYFVKGVMIGSIKG
ncbi:MAG: carbohydrate ABC transporter permease [Candidatus Limivivens sp.]|nr:carbohydrate ABC transporter permease [Candidatus Limivivens sp.]